MSAHDERSPKIAARTGEPMWRRYMRIRGDDPVADLDEELSHHLQSTEDDLIAQGMSPDNAREEAHRRFGNVNRVRDVVRRLDARHSRRTRMTEAFETFLQDMRYAVRIFLRSPTFTMVAMLSIAVGIAANATAFSVVNTLLFRPIPGTHANRLVRVYVNHHSPFSWHDLAWFRSHASSFTGIVGERSGGLAFRAPGATTGERVRTSMVSNGFFRTLGVRMALGRPFEGDEATATSSEPLVVLTHRFWQQRFASDSTIVGRTVTLAGHPVVVSGVLDPDFTSSVLGWSPDLLLPVGLSALLTSTPLEDIGGSFYTTARVREGVSVEASTAELRVLMSQLAATDTAQYNGMTVRLDHVRGVNAEIRGPAIAGATFVMLMVALVLVIACANVANLLIARAAARQTEIGVRLAIGAGRGRLIRQLLTESLLLAVGGGTLGLAGTYALTRLLAASLPAEGGIGLSFFEPDARVLAFTAIACLVTTLLFGLIPAMRAASPSVVPMLKATAQPLGSKRRRGTLMATQAGLCVVLLAIASLFGRSLVSMRSVSIGFNTDHVLDATIDAALVLPDAPSRLSLFERVLQDTKTVPGVEQASLSAIVPLTGSNMETRLAPLSWSARDRREYPLTRFNVVSAGYFSTMQIAMNAGREFNRNDTPEAERVAVINRTAAERWWPGVNAIGQRFHWGSIDGPIVTIVGIASDISYEMPGEAPRPFVYMPLTQEPRADVVLHVRTNAPVAAIQNAIWETLRVNAPALPPPSVTRMHDDIQFVLLPIRAASILLGALGAVALLLAATGIYGVTAYAVARRSREIGIRAALGANRARLLRMVVSESFRPVMRGAVLGLVLSSAAAFGLGKLLYGIKAFDPVVMPGVVLLLGIVAAAASAVPAWKAANIDPVSAIRSE